MINEQIIPCIADHFEAACLELFESLQCDIRRTSDNESAFVCVPIACIDAGSEDLEIVISLRLPLTLLSHTYPVQDEISVVDEAVLEDWLSELSNRLVGKIKRKLGAFGLNLQTGLPTSYFDADIDEVLPNNVETVFLYFEVDNEFCSASISVDIFNDALTFERQDSVAEDQAEEGELELF